MRIIIIGSSTGGPFILEKIMAGVPLLKTAMIIVQHLPPTFSLTFRNHIAALTKMEVVIAKDNSVLTEGHIFIAPAGFHLHVQNNRLLILHSGDKIHGVRPAVDHTLLSIQRRIEDKFLGIILTGMGRDGADGICHLHRIGGITVAQEPATSPIKSMPQATIETGEVDFILDPDQIREKIITFARL